MMLIIVDDNVVENLQERFSVQLSSANPRVIVQQSVANITITDDDGNKDFLLDVISMK